MTKAEEKRQLRAEAIEKLRKIAPAGSTIYAIVRTVSRSGMSRTIDFYVVDRRDGRLEYLTGYFAHVTGWPRAPSGALKVNGCGMDMRFHSVYETASVVFRDGAPKHIARAKRAGLAIGDSGTNPGYCWRSEGL